MYPKQVYVVSYQKVGGASVAQWVKHWPTDLAVVRSSPAWGEDLFNRK